MKFSDIDIRELLNSIDEGIYFVDMEGIIIYWNKGAEIITGYKSSEVIGKKRKDNILVDINGEGKRLCPDRCSSRSALQKNGSYRGDMFLHHKNGHRIPVSVRTLSIKNDAGELIGAMEIFTDNSAKIRAIERAKQYREMALFDKLTELPNRRFIEMKIGEFLQEYKRYDWKFGIIFFDIDDFKLVNDKFGHSVGDKVLKMVANTLSANSRSFDFVGRWGGEEFIVLAVNVGESDLKNISERYRILVQNSSLTIQDKIVGVSVSAGATMVSKNDTVDSLLNRVDKLMYKSKNEGKNKVNIG
ncbi:sensor domain-containing diguanylate cyclase [bacterium]|nr:MAG: sensor domain-containing diguanylate cyclase [bacterium]